MRLGELPHKARQSVRPPTGTATSHGMEERQMSIPASKARWQIAAIAAALAVMLAACSSGGGASSSPSSPAAVPSASAAAESPSATASEGAEPSESEEAAEEYKIEVATDATIGKYLTGEDGKTLYTFTPDTKANESTCTGDCAENWPPYVLEEDEEAEAGDGVTGKIATFDRPDGTMQVSYNGNPIYYFKGDAKAGDVNGQGLGGKWFAAKP
jgi:predicted lipoprotein with Yx(FWY)xxD motif